MKILFVNPRFPKSLWSFQGLADLVGVRSGQAPLGLATVAGMTPPDIDVEVVDENCYPIDFDTDADIVAIACWNVHYRRAIELSKEFRRRGKRVVVGGPYPTLCPERFDNADFDVIFEGETEITWPVFCRDLLAGALKPRYQQAGNVDIALSPVPRFDLLKKGDYLHYFVQTTRGCPFACEFCDIIITDGRVPRTKPVPQVIKELETIAAIGGRYVSFSDANFVGNGKYAEQLLHGIIDFGRANGFPMTYSAEMTVTVAEKPRLLELMREAGFTGIFLGIESPRIESLKETKKKQNVSKPLIDSVRTIQSHNIVVTAGMIVGFDNDDTRIFEEQLAFLQEAGIPFTTSGVLTAIEKTPLHARLEKEGRLLPYDSADRLGHGAADVNFVPKLMTVEEIKRGYNWLIRSLYTYDNYSARLVTGLRQFRADREKGSQTGSGMDWHLAGIALKVLRYYLLTTDSARRRFFLRTIRQSLASEPSFNKLTNAISYLIAHKHFHEYVTDSHGDPETVAKASPFAEAVGAEGEWMAGEFNQEYVERLRREMDKSRRGVSWLLKPRQWRVAVPEALLAERVGECLRHYLNELGVEVVPVATAALSRFRERVDLLVLPILGSVRKGREDLYQVVQQLQERVQADLDRLPRVIAFSLDGDHHAVLEGFARIGLTFTRKVERLRAAYVNAVERVMASPATSTRSSTLVGAS